MKEQALDIVKDGVTTVEYPPEIHRRVEEAAKLWQDFCALPEGVKSRFTIDDDHIGVGYEIDEHGRINFDYMHGGRADMEALLEAADEPVVSNFIQSADELCSNMPAMIDELGELIESKGVDGFKETATRSRDNAFLRFLYYPEQPEGAIIAEPHVDHSGFTFHLFETTEGCERLTLNKASWKPLPVADGEAVAFAGMQTQLVSEGRVKGLSHRVSANKVSSQNGRIAIVCFVGLEGVARYNKAKYGSLQKMEPGFNYNMQQDKFEQLFS